LLDTLLSFIATSQSHAGKETELNCFLASSAGTTLVELFQAHVASASSGYHVERFRKRSVPRSFVTVLFGSTDPLLFQPLLFHAQNIDFGEWIFVCNSPELAAATVRIGRMVSDLYDVMVTIILVRDNIGFGAANNIAISNASSDSTYIINPDVFPMESHSDSLRGALEANNLEDKLWGGLLFYDDQNLMHSGMYFDTDLFVRMGSHSRNGEAPAAVRLVRVEHWDKGVPFHAYKWTSPKAVPAISGAVMAFDRRYFERLGGFSTRYIYGHYEDADLSVRWADVNGPVVIDPRIRLVHFEGQGSKVHGDQYRGAAIVNRHFFTLQHSERLDRK
jgi:GT2 family glycosyltransferase